MLLGGWTQAAVNVVAHYRMGDADAGAVNGGTPVTMFDSAGANHLSVTGGARWTNDVSADATVRAGSALAVWFDGATGFATGAIPTTALDNFGIEAWVKSSNTNGSRVFAYNGNTGANGWGLIQNGTNFQALFGGRVVFGSVPAPFEVWTHLALVCTNGVGVFFTNGAVAGTTTNAPNVPFTFFGVGAPPQGPTNQFHLGSVDEVRVFTFAPGVFTTNDLLLNSPPLPPTILAASTSGVGAFAATVSGSVFPNGQAGTAWFEYGVTTNYGNTTSASALAATNSALPVSGVLGGLSAESPYFFRLVASNASGVSYGNGLSFTTAIAPAWLAPLPVLGGTNGAVTLRGRVNPAGHTALAWFEWGTWPGIFAQQTAPVNAGSGTDWILISNDISGITPGLAYTARLVVSNAAGVVRGTTMRFGGPALAGVNWITNECPAAVPSAPTASNAPLAIATGYSLHLVLRGDGTVAAWGGDGYGRTNVPTSATGIVSVAASAYHALAVRADGAVIAWGGSQFGVTNVPAAATNVVSVAAGWSHALAVRADGTVLAWGDNGKGQTSVPAAATNVVAVAAALGNSMALRADGTVLVWGDGFAGQTNVPPELTGVTDIGIGSGHCLALRSDGTIVGWGVNDHGETAPPPHATNIVALAGGVAYSVGLRADGAAVAWGYEQGGRTNLPPSATNIMAIASKGFATVLMSADGAASVHGAVNTADLNVPPTLRSLAVQSIGALVTNAPGVSTFTVSAVNALGQVVITNRNVTVVDTLPPTLTILGANPRTVIMNSTFVDSGVSVSDACGGAVPVVTNSTVNIASEGTYAITYIATDSAGNSVTNTRTVIVLAAVPIAITDATTSSNGLAHLLARIRPGGLPTVAWAEWGLTANALTNRVGPVALGDSGDFVTNVSVITGLVAGSQYYWRAIASNALGASFGSVRVFSTPILTLTGAASLTNECHFAFTDPGAVNGDQILQVVNGWNHTVVRRAGGALVAWGAGETNSGLAPHVGQSIVPASATSIVHLAAGRWHTLAARANGTVVAWGNNASGQTNVMGSYTNVVAVGGGDEHSLALRANGTVFGWGNNGAGQINVPSSVNNIAAISAGAAHNLALRSNGTVVAWGSTGSGESSVPAAATNVMAIAAGESYSVALRSNGTVIAWGNNGLGQTNVPPSATNVIAIAVGRSFTLALRADRTVLGWGFNGQGQLNVPSFVTNVVAISAGDGHSHALVASGQILHWGTAANAQNITATFTAPPATVTGSVDTNTPGTYSLTYTASNSIGGQATVTRTVVVRDTLSPLLSLNGPALVILTNASPPWVDPGATATDLCAGTFSAVGQSNINFSVPGSYTALYVATDGAGNAVTNTRQVIVAYTAFTPPTVPGDTNGDGVISQAELAGVLANLNGTGAVTPGDLSMILSNYWPTSPWLLMTSVAGLGTPNVKFALPGAVEAPFRVESSTNLVDWENLGPLTPRYEFLDTNAPMVPNRSYRLRWP